MIAVVVALVLFGYMLYFITDEHSLRLYFREKLGLIQAFGEQYEMVILALLFVTFLIIKSFMLPGAIALTAVCGAVFDPWKLLPIVVISCTLGGFILHRYLKRLPKDNLETAWAKYAGRVAHFTSHHPFKTTFLCRINPLMPEIATAVLLAITKVPDRTFLTATILAMTPFHALYLYFGKTILTAI